MSNIEVHPGARMSHKMSVGGTAVETLLGLAAVVLSILALAGLVVGPLASIAVIAAGAALVFESAALSRAGEGEDRLVKGGIGADAVAGIAGVALGILSLIGLDPTILLPVAAIVLGAGLLLSSGALSVERERAGELERATTAAAGVRSLVGAGAVVLGILALLGQVPILLTLIATLSIGAGILLSGATFGGRVASLFRHPA